MYHDVLVVAESTFGVYNRITKERLPFNRMDAPAKFPEAAPTHEHGECFWFADDWSMNFGHFLMDSAHTLLEWNPRLHILCNNVPYVYQLVELWRPCARYTPLVLDKSVHHVRSLYRPAPLFGHSAGEIPPHVLHFLMELRCKAPDVFGPIPLVMITRRDARRRPISNEAELIQGMMKLGFIPFEFSTLSLVERISTIRQARVVFSHCGAPAVNYAWITPGTATITLYSPTLHGEEKHNSILTRAMGGVPHTLDEYGNPVTGQTNASDDYAAPWSIPSVPVILDAVKRIVAAI